MKKITNSLTDGYELQAAIGEGTFGIIYKAKQNNTGQIVAVKLLKPIKSFSTENSKLQMDCFYKEASIYSKINHPNIIKLVDKGVANKKQPFFVFEYIEGITLKDFISKQKQLCLALVKEIMLQVLDAINHYFNRGIVHCDLKPQNIMIVNTGLHKHVKILDFGTGIISKKKHQNQAKNRIESVKTNSKGTPNYCAPEQLRGEIPSVKSDLYAWGLILIECLTGRAAIQGESITQIIQKQLSNEAVSLPSDILSHPIASILKKVLNKNPSLRSGKPKLIYEEFLKTDLETLDICSTSVSSTSMNKNHRTMINSLHRK